jgi:hypothetical protein
MRTSFPHSKLPNRRIVAVALCTALACGRTDETSNASAIHAPASHSIAPQELRARTALSPALAIARESVWRAYFTGDSALLVTLLPERMVGMEETRAQIIANAQEFARGRAKYQGITFTDDELVASDSMAVTFARYEVKLLDNGKPQTLSGRAIEIFELRNGQWINPSWHLHEKP